MRLVVLSLTLLICAAPLSHAVQPDEILADATQEARARDLSAELRCMVCQNQSIDDSDAPLARDLRLLIRERIAAGDTNGEVIDFVVARYGEFVLLRPPFNARTALLWAMPMLLLLAGAFALFRAWRRGREVRHGEAEPLSEEERRQLAGILAERSPTDSRR